MAKRTGSRTTKAVTQHEVNAKDIIRTWAQLGNDLATHMHDLESMAEKHPRQAIEAALELIQEHRDSTAYWERVTAERAVLTHGITQKVVANELCISTQTIGRWVKDPTSLNATG